MYWIRPTVGQLCVLTLEAIARNISEYIFGYVRPARAAWRRHVCALFGHQRPLFGFSPWICMYCGHVDPKLIAIMFDNLICDSPFYRLLQEPRPYRVPSMFPTHVLRKPPIFGEGA